MASLGQNVGENPQHVSWNNKNTEFEEGRQNTVLPGVICTLATGFMRWTHGQYTRFARASTSGRTNEARDETETKPTELSDLQ